MAKKTEQVVPEIIDSVEGLNARWQQCARLRRYLQPTHRSR